MHRQSQNWSARVQYLLNKSGLHPPYKLLLITKLCIVIFTIKFDFFFFIFQQKRSVGGCVYMAEDANMEAAFVLHTQGGAIVKKVRQVLHNCS